MAREFSKYPVARITIILMRIVAILMAISFPIEAIAVALSGDPKPSERKAAEEKAAREFQKRLQERRMDPEQQKIETEKEAQARLDREFVKAETTRKFLIIMTLLFGSFTTILAILLSAELLQVLLDISRNTQDTTKLIAYLGKAQRMGTEPQDVG
jgi:DNA-binding transcriptional MerR regulator